jgi:NTE family protein
MSTPKEINLALQGGGAHGAFGWGVLDKLLEDGRVDVDGLCGTSAGAMNAVVYAYGKMRGGNDGARQSLHDFWKKNAEAGARYSPVRPMPKLPGFGDFVMPGLDRDFGVAASHWMFESFTRMFSPYQFNPHDVNPLRDVLNAVVDFDELKQCYCTNLFLAATNVRSGKVRIFRNNEMSIEAVLASAALPFLFKAVEIEGEFYWDGGYMGNPVLYPLFYHTRPRDIVIVHINPIERERVPTTPAEIANRVNEITFNSSLLKELRAVELAQRIVTEGWLKEEHQGRMRHMLIHAIRNDAAMAELSVSSKLSPDWEFLCRLRDRGRVTAQHWLDHHFDDLGERSSVDLKREFLEARP